MEGGLVQAAERGRAALSWRRNRAAAPAARCRRWPDDMEENGRPSGGRIRTCDLRLRRPVVPGRVKRLRQAQERTRPRRAEVRSPSLSAYAAAAAAKKSISSWLTRSASS
jgi:hypothetical protein